MRRFTVCDFQYIHLKLRHYKCYHDEEKKAIEIRNKSLSAEVYRRDAESAEKNPEERLEGGKIGGAPFQRNIQENLSIPSKDCQPS